MPNYNGSSTNDGIGFNTSSSNSSLDWLNAGLNQLQSTAMTAIDLKSQWNQIKQADNQQVQKTYQDSSQIVGSKNLVPGYDNNIILLGVGAVIVGFMFLKD